MLSFQKLDVYRCAIDFLAPSVELAAAVPRGYAALGDQLRRAALSVPLNIAEASGRLTDADAARHHGIARGSAMECAAIVDGLRVLGAIDEARHAAAVALRGRIVAMLTKLSR
jgi:four helix bundle protein